MSVSNEVLLDVPGLQKAAVAKWWPLSDHPAVANLHSSVP